MVEDNSTLLGYYPIAAEWTSGDEVTKERNTAIMFFVLFHCLLQKEVTLSINNYNYLRKRLYASERLNMYLESLGKQ